MPYGRDPRTGQRLLGISDAEWNQLRDARPPSYWRDGVKVQSQRTAAAPEAHIIDSRFPDYSSWDATTFSASCFRDTGIVRAMVQSDVSGATDCAKLKANDIERTAVYAFAYYGAGTQPQQATDRSIMLALDTGAPVVCFDSELDADGANPTPEQRIATMDECLKQIESARLKPWVYTAPWFHVPKLNNWPGAAERGVGHHLADFGLNDGRRSPKRMNAFDYAWAFNIAHQFWSLANYCGRVERDLSYLWSDALPEADMSPDDTRAMIQAEIAAAVADSKIVANSEWLTLFAQTVGVLPSSFSDADTLAAIRAKLATNMLDAAKLEQLAAAAGGFQDAIRAILTP